MKEFDKFFKNDGMYWNARKTLTYNSLYNFIVGMRGSGKTFGAGALAAERFLQGKGKFIYLRRYSTELVGLTSGIMPTFYDELQAACPSHKFEVSNDLFTIDEMHAGWAVPLSTSNIRKSISYKDVGLIVFDEFIIDNKGVYHYLQKEVNLFNTFYQTVVRNLDRFVPILFLSNAVTVSNPYFDFYHIDKPRDGERIRRYGQDKLILVENVVPPENAKRVKQSAWYKVNAGTEYADYAVDNAWLLDNTDFIAKKNRRCVYTMSLRYMGKWLGIWMDPQDWIYYVSRDVDLQYPRKYSVTTDDHKPNVLLLKGARKLPFMVELEDAYEQGCVRYENMQLKNEFRDIMRMSKNR